MNENNLLRKHKTEERKKSVCALWCCENCKVKNRIDFIIIRN